jgi:hypothetical protein
MLLFAVAAAAAASAATPPTDTSWYGKTQHGEEFVNIKDFGAIGDGVQDDTVAIQRAINHNRLLGGLPPPPTARPFAPPRRAVVYLPPGTYVVVTLSSIAWLALERLVEGDKCTPTTQVVVVVVVVMIAASLTGC